MPITVTGELVPSNIASNSFAYRWFCETFMQDETRKNQYLVNKSLDKWEWKEEESFPVFLQYQAEGVYGEAERVLNYIAEVTQSPIGVALNINGFLNIVLEGRSGLSIFNVHITDGEIIYREGFFNFLTPITMPMRGLEANQKAENVEEENDKISPLIRKST